MTWYNGVADWIEEYIPGLAQAKQRLPFLSKGVLIGAGVILLAGTSYYGYFSYTANKDRAAELLLNECLEQYEKAAANHKELWPTVEAMCAMAYEHHQSSRVAPYFLIMCAQALVQQGKIEHAYQELSKALKILPQSSPLYDVYTIQHALMSLDMFDEATVNGGLAELKKLAANEQSNVSDMALYYLGSYYLMHDERQEAENYWNQLKKYDAPESARRSPWLAYAQAKMN